MAKVLSFIMFAFVALAASAQEASVMTAEEADSAAEAGPDAPEVVEEPVPVLEFLDAGEVSLDEYLWTYRPIVVFADTPADPRFREQIKLLSERPGELIVRDVVVITDTDPDARSGARLKLRPRGFQLTLMGKDGRVNLRKPFPWNVREISRAIDKWPLRQEEIRAGGFGQ